MDRIKIAIADDHQLFREGLITILSAVDQFEVLYDVDTGEKLIERVQENRPDIILLDLKMPDMDGIQVTEVLKARDPSIKIMILSMHHQEDFILHMLNLGVNAYLQKNTSSNTLRDAIFTTYANDYYFDDEVSKIMLHGLKKKQLHRPRLDGTGHLTPREVEILELICREYTTGEIASKLFLSQRTVETHRKNLLEKLGAKNTAGLVIRAIASNYVQIDFS